MSVLLITQCFVVPPPLSHTQKSEYQIEKRPIDDTDVAGVIKMNRTFTTK